MRFLAFNLIISCMLWTPTSWAVTNSENVLYIGQWTTICDNGKSEADKICAMERNLFKEKDNINRYLTLGVRTKSGEAPILSLLVPHGVLLAPGVTIELFGDPINIPYIFCNGAGCLAQLKLSDVLLSNLSAYKVLKVRFHPINQKTVQINFDLTGFDMSFKKIKR